VVFSEAACASHCIACDIETSGLDWRNDRIATCQIYVPNHAVALVRFDGGRPTNLIGLLEDPAVAKIFHHAMFDLRFLVNKYDCDPANIKCTKVASKLLRKGEHSHSLTELVKRYFQVVIDKGQQKSDWFRPDLTPTQIKYAAADVLFLPALLDVLLGELETMRLREYAERCFAHIPTQVWLEVRGYTGIYEY
jgi:ribonuclease D